MCNGYEALKALSEAQQKVKELTDNLHSAHYLTMPRFYYAAAVEDSLKRISYSLEKAKDEISRTTK